MNQQTFTITKFSDLANPSRFLALSARILPRLAVLTALVLAAGLYLSFTTDGDYQQGYTVRIMYVHVPSAAFDDVLYRHGGLSDRHARLASSGCGCQPQGGRTHRRCLHADCACYRLALG